METAEAKSVTAQPIQKTPWWAGLVAFPLGMATLSLIANGLWMPALLMALATAACFAPVWGALERSTGRPTSVGMRRVITGGLFLVAMIWGGVIAGPVSTEQAGSDRTAKPANALEEGKVALAKMEANKEQQRLEWKRMEDKNHDQIMELLAGVKKFPANEPEMRLNFWKDITRLAPGNEEYAAKRREVEKEVAEYADAVAHPEQAAEIVKMQWHKGGFGAVMIADVTITNRALSHLKDFQITCTSQGPSGSNVGSTTNTLYEMVKSRQTKTFRNVNMGFINSQAATANCVVDQASIG